MAKASPDRKPTDSELAILAVVWERGSATVREVYDAISERQEVGYTTILKFMQIMTEKGLLAKDATVRPQVFKATKPQKQTQSMLLGDLVDRAFSGSPGNLVLRALSMRKSTPEELREIRKMLDELEGDKP